MATTRPAWPIPSFMPGFPALVTVLVQADRWWRIWGVPVGLVVLGTAFGGFFFSFLRGVNPRAAWSGATELVGPAEPLPLWVVAVAPIFPLGMTPALHRPAGRGGPGPARDGSVEMLSVPGRVLTVLDRTDDPQVFRAAPGALSILWPTTTVGIFADVFGVALVFVARG